MSKNALTSNAKLALSREHLYVQHIAINHHNIGMCTVPFITGMIIAIVRNQRTPYRHFVFMAVNQPDEGKYAKTDE